MSPNISCPSLSFTIKPTVGLNSSCRTRKTTSRRTISSPHNPERRLVSFVSKAFLILGQLFQRHLLKTEDGSSEVYIFLPVNSGLKPLPSSRRADAPIAFYRFRREGQRSADNLEQCAFFGIILGDDANAFSSFHFK